MSQSLPRGRIKGGKEGRGQGRSEERSGRVGGARNERRRRERECEARKGGERERRGGEEREEHMGGAIQRYPYAGIPLIHHRPCGDWRARGSGMDSSGVAWSGSGWDWLVALRGS